MNEKELKLICPLLKADCGAGCAWYSNDYEMCSVPLLVATLQDATTDAGSLKIVTPETGGFDD